MSQKIMTFPIISKIILEILLLIFIYLVLQLAHINEIILGIFLAISILGIFLDILSEIKTSINVYNLYESLSEHEKFIIYSFFLEQFKLLDKDKQLKVESIIGPLSRREKKKLFEKLNERELDRHRDILIASLLSGRDSDLDIDIDIDIGD